MSRYLIDSQLEFVDFRDRYGHPSLAVPEFDYDPGYDGSVYCGGSFKLKDDELIVSFHSGRFHHENLSRFSRVCLQLYLSIRLLEFYPVNTITFFKKSEKESVADVYSFMFIGAIKWLNDNEINMEYFIDYYINNPDSNNYLRKLIAILQRLFDINYDFIGCLDSLYRRYIVSRDYIGMWDEIQALVFRSILSRIENINSDFSKVLFLSAAKSFWIFNVPLLSLNQHWQKQLKYEISSIRCFMSRFQKFRSKIKI